MRNFLISLGHLLIIVSAILSFFTAESISNNVIFIMLSGIAIILLLK